MNVLTTCVIVAERSTSSGWAIRGVATGHAMCMPEDNFQKKFARDWSFRRAVDCAFLRDVKDQLIAAYEAMSGPMEDRSHRKSLTSRERHVVAQFLDSITSGFDDETAAKLKEATAALRKSNGTKVSQLDPAIKQARIDAGNPVREMRATQEGRATLAAQRKTAQELPQAAG